MNYISTRYHILISHMFVAYMSRRDIMSLLVTGIMMSRGNYLNQPYFRLISELLQGTHNISCSSYHVYHRISTTD